MAVIYTTPTVSKKRSDNDDSNKYVYYMTVDVQSQDIVHNSSTVLFTLYMKAESSGVLMWNTSKANAPTGKIKINGTSYASTISVGNSSSAVFIDDGKIRRYTRSTTPTTICSKTLTFEHDGNGEKYINVGFNWVAGSGLTTDFYPVSFASSSYTVQLPTIARVGIITAPASVLVDNTVSTMPYTITSYGHYWFDLTYTLEGNTATALTKQEIDNTDYAATITYAWLEEHLTLAQSANLTFTLTAYEDALGNTLVGSVTQTVVINIDLTVFKPTFTWGSISPHTDGLNGRLVAGISTAEASYTATPGGHASGVIITFSATNATLVSYTSTATSGTAVTNVLPSSESDTTVVLTAKIEDTRGAKQYAIYANSETVYGYTPPVITATAMRVANIGDTTEDSGGEYVYVLCSSVTNSSVDGQNSIQSNSITYNGTPLSNPDWQALAGSSSGTFTFTATDNVSSSTTTITVPIAIFPLDLVDPDGTAQHLGAAIAGPIAEADYVKLGNGNVTELDMLNAFYKFRATGFKGFQDGNETDANSLIPQTDDNEPKFGDIGIWFTNDRTNRTNWPTSTIQFGFLITFVLEDGGAYAVQFCYMNTQSYLYQRILSNNNWGAWKKVTFS